MPHPALLPQPKGAIPPYIWRDARQYYSMPELARRRGVTRQAAAKWAKHHPGYCTRLGRHTYAQDIQT